VEIQLQGDEIPLMDGSALNWVEAIVEAGIQPAATPLPDRHR
jgi:UDP-3-O-[3-hydroxymyristoyl] N-acetylglucosamine deacetylase